MKKPFYIRRSLVYFYCNMLIGLGFLIWSVLYGSERDVIMVVRAYVVLSGLGIVLHFALPRWFHKEWWFGLGEVTYIHDVIEVEQISQLPKTGLMGAMYLVKNIYRVFVWDGRKYCPVVLNV